jgi:glucosyl-3-phosphoglycerate phosphatase
MKRLMIVRHGESEWNADRRLQGRADIGLSDRGRSQAAALRPVIEALSPDRAVTSSLRRARQTAAIVGFPDAEAREELCEIDVGDWTGQSIGDLVAQAPETYRAWRAGKFTPGGGESWSEFLARIDRVTDELLDGPERAVLLVAHGGVLRALLERLLSLSPDRIVPVAPGSLTILRQGFANGRDDLRLEVFNFSPAGPQFDAPD